ncbi:MAG: class IV adenylate cyclase [Halobacterium sp.]
MYEVEVKVPADHEAVRERLRAAGAAVGDRVAQEDTYFDAPHREFVETDEALRVRRFAAAAPTFERDGAAVGPLVETILDGDGGEAATSEVTYKGPLVDAASKTREEFETGVGDGDAMREILVRLGFEPAATVRKLREHYSMAGLTVSLDAVEGVGEYVEVETEVETEDEVGPAREEAYAVLRELDLDPTEQVQTSYLGLALEDA